MGGNSGDVYYYAQEAWPLNAMPAPRQGLAPKWDGIDAFSVAQVAEILGVSANTVYAGLAAGTIPCFNIGRRKIIGRPAIERLLGYR